MRLNGCRTRTACGLVVMVCCGWLPGLRADPPSSRGGGLVPGTSAPATRATREELLRDWDLDGDGSISKSEAEIARARMRRKRLEIQLGGGIDPVTGLPRGIDGATESSPAEPADEPLYQLPPEPPSSESSRAQPEPLPGMRAPGPQPPLAGPQAPRPHAAVPPGGEPAAAAPSPLSARASWLPPQRLAPAITGGVRAGAPAATGGYGSASWGDLNAGRRPPSLPASGAGPGGGSTSVSGGLLPSVRQPGRTGAMILPTPPARPSNAAVPGPPPAPAFGGNASPRVTADEIGAGQP